MHETPLVDREYQLEKFPGKGGWTYAAIPEVGQNPSNPFGWVTVRGSIDSFELEHYKLMPMGNGQLFLPVKAAIRKEIKKQAGDFVKIVLYTDNSAYELPGEILECFKNEPPTVYDAFLTFTEGQQKAYIDWIYDAKTDETKAQRIVTMLDRVARKLKFGDSED